MTLRAVSPYLCCYTVIIPQFQDATINFRVIKEDQQAANHLLNNEFVGDQAQKAVMGIRDCPVKRATLCVTSEAEMDKCIKMRVSEKFT